MTQTELKPAGRLGRHRRRSSWMRAHASVLTCAAVVLAAAAAVAAVKLPRLAGGPAASARQVRQVQPIRYFGVFEPDAPRSFAGIDQFGRTVGRQPNLVSYYSGWGESFRARFAQQAADHHATLLVFMSPTNVPVAQVASGHYDWYLKSFARAVAAYKHPVIISFAHEMNGFWYSWGYHHTPARVFVRAWRHVVDVFRAQGATNTKWLWVVNSFSRQTGPVHSWWPGKAYVTWVGISGYYWKPGETFDYVFGRVAARIRRFSHAPVLIAETGVGPFRGRQASIDNLFAGVRAQHFLGLIWFDVHSHGGIYKGENWRLEGDPGVIAGFRTALLGHRS